MCSARRWRSDIVRGEGPRIRTHAAKLLNGKRPWPGTDLICTAGGMGVVPSWSDQRSNYDAPITPKTGSPCRRVAR